MATRPRLTGPVRAISARLTRRPHRFTYAAPFHSETLERRTLFCLPGLDGQSDFSPLPDAALIEATAASGATQASATTSAPLSLADTFRLHSRPQANHRIHLDFDGHVTKNTSWNVNGPFTTPAFDIDGDPTTFTDEELTRIQYIYQRVAEDYAPFELDITTEEPVASDLLITGTADTRWGVRIVIGGSGEWYGSAGGVAYLRSFNWGDDTPAFVFSNLLGDSEKYVAEAASHEGGHTLGPHHQGTPTTQYYAGQGSGETGWAPIMGVGYYRNLTQWSQSDFLNGQSPYGVKQDDLAMIAGGANGFGYRVDDIGPSSLFTPSLNGAGGDVSGAGVIERSSDTDLFSFYSEAGTINLDVLPFERGPNLDILAELLDADGNVILESNPLDLLAANLTADVPAGSYFVRVNGVGRGDPLVDGYSDYGSLGQYTISGQVVAPAIGISVGDVTTSEATGSAMFTLSLSQPSSEPVTVTATTVADSAVVTGDFTAVNQTVTFAPGETSRQVSVPLTSDSVSENEERFVLRLSGASGSGAAIVDGVGVATVLDDDAPSVAISNATAKETNPGRKGALQTTSMTFTVSLSWPSVQPVSVSYVTSDGTALAGSDYFATSGKLTFNPGETSKTLTVFVIGDTLIEPDETLLMNLADVTNAQIGDGQGVGTIQDNDRPKGKGGGGGSGVVAAVGATPSQATGAPALAVPVWPTSVLAIGSSSLETADGEVDQQWIGDH